MQKNKHIEVNEHVHAKFLSIVWTAFLHYFTIFDCNKFQNLLLQKHEAVFQKKNVQFDGFHSARVT